MAKAKEQTTDLMVLDPKQYPAIVNGEQTLAVIRDNMGGEEVTAADLRKIKVPSGEATSWMVTDLSGETEAIKTLEGVIVHSSRQRAYWPQKTITGEPPTCSANGLCKIGVGDPGGRCNDCPMDAYGTALKDNGERGRGKACKESRFVFLIRPGELLPDVVVIPGGSLANMKKYLLQLSARGAPFWSVLTGLGLSQETNKDGKKYSQVRPIKLATLNEETATQILAYAQTLQTIFAKVEVNQGDVDTAAPRTQEC